MPLEDFQRCIIGQTWSDHFLDMKNLHGDKAAQDKYKKTQLPYVTPSGTFSKRSADGLIKHSNVLALDFDDVDPEATKEKLRNDKYVFFAFTTISGNGVCAFIQIDGKKHAEAFDGAAEYFYTNYGLVADQSCSDIPRARFVSHDPLAYQNGFAEKFLEYPKKDKVLNPTKVPNMVYVEDDFNMVMQEIGERKIDITGNYKTWLRIGFAFADKFGESGLAHFHAVSENSPTYDARACDRQYRSCLKSRKAGVNIATFYYYAKLAGLTIVSEKTNKISRVAYSVKQARSDQKAAHKHLLEFEGLIDEAGIIDQIFTNDIKIADVSEFESWEVWLKENYSLRRNEVTGRIENSGKAIRDLNVNDIYIAAKKVFDKIPYQDIQRLIESSLVPTYNPFAEFIDAHKSRQPQGVIARYFGAVKSVKQTEFVEFATRWLVGLLNTMCGGTSPLMLILIGEPGTGKTRFFEDLLPMELQDYFINKPIGDLSSGTLKRDFEITITKKLLWLDDEFSGKSKRDGNYIKQVQSSKTTTGRAAYGRHDEDRKRIAVFCGTTNFDNILDDPTGNRRYLPFGYTSIDYATINSIDRVDLLIEAYHLLKSDYKWQVLGSDIKRLAGLTTAYESVSIESELFQKYFQIPEIKSTGEGVQFFSTSEIKVHIDSMSFQRLNVNRLGAEIKKLYGERESFRRSPGANPAKGYFLIQGTEHVDSSHRVDTPF